MARKIKYNKIKDELERQGKTQAWLAQALKINYQTVTRYVNNNRQPSLTKLFKIAEALKVRASDLIND